MITMLNPSDINVALDDGSKRLLHRELPFLYRVKIGRSSG
jgi:hypothetical protein